LQKLPVGRRIVFKSREDAGAKLAERLDASEKSHPDLLLAIANGGAVIARPIAARLHCAVALCCISRIKAPGVRDLTIGAVYGTNGALLNHDIIRILRLTVDEVSAAQHKARELKVEAELKVGAIREGWLASARRILIVDDGIATGYSMAAAAELANSLGSAEASVAAPVVSSYGFRTIVERVSEVIYLHYTTAPNFRVRPYYNFFPEVSLSEAAAQLKGFRPAIVDSYPRGAGSPSPSPPLSVDKLVPPERNEKG
jgi:putative phosphoribosyl transferase